MLRLDGGAQLCVNMNNAFYHVLFSMHCCILQVPHHLKHSHAIESQTPRALLLPPIDDDLPLDIDLLVETDDCFVPETLLLAPLFARIVCPDLLDAVGLFATLDFDLDMPPIEFADIVLLTLLIAFIEVLLEADFVINGFDIDIELFFFVLPALLL